MGNSSMTKNKVSEYTCGLMAVNMKAGGIGANSTELEPTSTARKAQSNTEFGKTEKESNGMMSSL